MFTRKLEAHMACDWKLLSKVKDFSRSQAVAYTGKVIIFQKQW